MKTLRDPGLIGKDHIERSMQRWGRAGGRGTASALSLDVSHEDILNVMADPKDIEGSPPKDPCLLKEARHLNDPSCTH